MIKATPDGQDRPDHRQAPAAVPSEEDRGPKGPTRDRRCPVCGCTIEHRCENAGWRVKACPWAMPELKL